MIFKVRFSVAGSHVHCRFFSAVASHRTFAKLGDFVVARGYEFVAVRDAMSGVAFVGETDEHTVSEASRP